MIEEKSNSIILHNFPLILNSLDDLVLVIDSNYNFKIKEINGNGCLENLGYGNSELLGTSFLDIIHQDDIQNIIKIMKKKKEKTKRSREVRIQARDGSFLWFDVRSKISMDKDTEKSNLIILRDITEKKDLEEKLRESEDRIKKVSANFPEIQFWRLHSTTEFDTLLHQTLDMLKVVIGSIPQMIFWKDIDLNYLGCNKQYADFIGIPQPENLIGKTDKNLTLINSFKDYHNLEQKIIEEKAAVYHLNEQITLDNGKKIWLEINRIPLMNTLGKVGGILVTYEDITEKKESEEKYKTLFKQSPMSIIIIDKKGVFFDCNPSQVARYGWKKDELIGKNFMDLNFFPKDPQSLKKAMEAFKSLLKGKISEPFEIQSLKRDGSPIWVKIYLSFIQFGEEEMIQVISYDITAQKVAELAVRESERKFKTIFEAIPDLYFLLDKEGTLLEYQGSSKDLLMPPDQFLGKKIDSLIPLDIKKKSMNAINQTLITKKPQVFEYELEIDGRTEYFEARMLYYSGEKVSTFIRNISEQKRYNKTFTELNACFLSFTSDNQNNISLLLETCRKNLEAEKVIWVFKSERGDTDHIHILDPEGELSLMTIEEFENEHMANEFFKANHEFPQVYLNVPQFDFFKDDIYIKEHKIEGIYGKLIKIRDKLDSGIIAFFKSSLAISNVENLIILLISDAISVERGRWLAELDIVVQNKRLNEINRLKTEFISRTSHELKTPLISIKGFTELLLSLHSSKLDSDMTSILTEIKTGSTRLEKIINSLLDTSRIEEGKMVLNRSMEDLSFLIKFCVRDLEGLLHLRKLSLTVDIDDELMTIFDKERIYEVLSNLIINAIKYTPPMSKIEVNSEKKDDRIIISVKDSGIGITEEEKDQLFTQFGKIERYGKGWDIDIEGSGLGLYIAKGIIDLHGGEIWVESEGRNKGSTFYFSLPIID